MNVTLPSALQRKDAAYWRAKIDEFGAEIAQITTQQETMRTMCADLTLAVEEGARDAAKKLKQAEIEHGNAAQRLDAKTNALEAAQRRLADAEAVGADKERETRATIRADALKARNDAAKRAERAIADLDDAVHDIVENTVKAAEMTKGRPPLDPPVGRAHLLTVIAVELGRRGIGSKVLFSEAMPSFADALAEGSAYLENREVK